ncbi:MAG: MBL fold metallo-hydrolase [Firmicutes bacterium]|nr:MBL fold metallo-hydrolase [Bacillota bacterium]
MKIPIHKLVSVVRGKKPTRFPYCNCLLFEDRTRAIIETATEIPVLQEIESEKVDLVLNSHAHLDHMHGNWAFPNARIGLHTESAPLARSKEVYGDSFILDLWKKLMPLPLNILIPFDRPQDALEIRDSRIVQYPESRVDFTLEDGEELDLGKVKLRVIHAPGHCRGHCCFFWEAEGILFSSDIDFTGGGPWYGNGTADLGDFLKSIDMLVDLSPRITVPAHGRVIEGNLAEPARRFAEHIHRREETILEKLDRPRTLDELEDLKMFHEVRLHLIFHFWEKVMILKHLDRMVQMGVVVQEGDLYYKA